MKLTPFSVETLDHLVFLERPRGSNHENGDAHYQRFVTMRKVFLELTEANSAFAPSLRKHNPQFAGIVEALAAIPRQSVERK